MNSLLNQMAESSPGSQSRGTKRNTIEESAKAAAKRPRIVPQDDSSLFSFIRNLFPSVSSMFEQNEEQNTVIDLSDTTDDFYTCSKTEDKTTEDNTTEDNITEDNTTEDNTTEDNTTEDNTTEDNTTEDNSMIFLYERIAIYNNDIDCLEEGKFLNDKIIDFVLSILRDSYRQNQTYVFDSMFFIKLRDIRDPKNYYRKTSSWFKNGVLSKKIWVIPVCDNYHWYVITVVNPESVRPQILVMDSWKREYYTSVDIVKEFLKQKFSAEQEGDIEGINVEIVDIPQQTNPYDCGLYAIRSAELFMTELAPYYISLILDQENKITSSHEIYRKVELLTRSQIVRYFIDILKKHD